MEADLAVTELKKIEILTSRIVLTGCHGRIEIIKMMASLDVVRGSVYHSIALIVLIVTTVHQ